MKVREAFGYGTGAVVSSHESHVSSNERGAEPSSARPGSPLATSSAPFGPYRNDRTLCQRRSIKVGL